MIFTSFYLPFRVNMYVCVGQIMDLVCLCNSDDDAKACYKNILFNLSLFYSFNPWVSADIWHRGGSLQPAAPGEKADQPAELPARSRGLGAAGRCQRSRGFAD